MLLRLSIRDFILVDALELEFASGFGALTGETGAGKSILIDAIGFVLGERAESGWVRAGAGRAEVAAEFDISALPGPGEILAAQDIESGETLLLRRVVDSAGRSRAYVNGASVTLQQLRDLGDSLVDIHGQHAHQSLLRADSQRAIVDSFGGHAERVRAVAGHWREWRAAAERLREVRAGGEAVAREREQLEWDVRELEALSFGIDEWALLNAEQARLAHAAGLAEGAQFAVELLGEAEPSCLGALSSVLSRLESLGEFDARLEPIVALLRSAEAEASEALADLRRYASQVELDPGRLAEVDRRIEGILGCARKHRVAAEALPDLLARRRARLAELRSADDPAALAAEVEQTRDRYAAAAAALTEARQAAGSRLAAEVGAKMHELALGGGRFEIVRVAVEGGSAAGDERLEFRVGGLAGTELQPLAKVASGGELSRISLAIQVAASQAASVPTMIFDEVDVGIGGGVAEVVGRLLKALGERRQVLCVTHLPQVAARADWQWRVAKCRDGDSFRSEVATLDAAGRVEEIARMLGGVEITPLTRRHAEEMLSGD